jgi:DNA-binding NarL/FixJ family response regulator
MQILALSPGDIPHDRVILTIRASASGFVTRDADINEFAEAIEVVNQGQHWLPLEETYEVLDEAKDPWIWDCILNLNVETGL